MKRLICLKSIFFIIMFSIGCKNPEPETYLIPLGFKGKVAIIFNHVNGSKPIYENGRRLYKIPLNGVLLTQFKYEEGFIDHRYYYNDHLGNRTPLEIFKYDYDKNGSIRWTINDPSTIGIFNDGTVGSLSNSKYLFQEFSVCNLNEYDTINNKSNFEKFNDKLKLIIKDAFDVDTLVVK